VIIRKKNPKGIFTKARDAIPGKCAITNTAPDKVYLEIDVSPAPNEKVIIHKNNPKGIFTKARDAIPGKRAIKNPAPDKVLFGDRCISGAE
jgi:hypothetical protein